VCGVSPSLRRGMRVLDPSCHGLLLNGPASHTRQGEVDGNPGEKGLYAIRFMLPANYKVPAHWHPNDEHVVVLSGALYMGMGDKLDLKAGKALRAGGFALVPAKKHHYAYTKEATAILVYGMGPVEFTYVNPADDPRKSERQ